MIKAVKFDKELARIYDETRPIDSEGCCECFRDALQGINGKKDARIVDVGCGTGRILECLVAGLVRKEQVVGIDVSSAILEVARSKSSLRGVEFHDISVVDFAKSASNQQMFDVVICHWLFHCLPDWKKVFRACVDLAKPNGVLAWLEEEGDLYRVLDGMDASNAPLVRLFEAYYESVNKELHAHGSEKIAPSVRAGTMVRCTDDLANELNALGWNVQTQFKTHRWTRQVTVGWIFESIFERRVFTNLRRIPPGINLRAITKLKQRLGKGRLPKASDIVELKFWAKAVTAISSSKPMGEHLQHQTKNQVVQTTVGDV